jgi:hypothetical protein
MYTSNSCELAGCSSKTGLMHPGHRILPNSLQWKRHERPSAPPDKAPTATGPY